MTNAEKKRLIKAHETNIKSYTEEIPIVISDEKMTDSEKMERIKGLKREIDSATELIKEYKCRMGINI